MDTKQIEVRHLRQLVEIADRGDLASAARALGLPAAALRKRLGGIETLAGAVLFERGPSGLVPTTRGAEVVDTARAVLAELSDLTGGTVDRPVLRLAAVDALLPQAVMALARSRPDLSVASRSAGPVAAVDAVLGGIADVAVSVRWPHVPWPQSADCPERRIARRPLQVLVADTHPLAGRAVVDLTDLAGDPWCVRADADVVASVSAECRRWGMEPDVRYRMSGDAEVLGLVTGGHAVALTAHPDRAMEGLSRLAYRGAAAAEWVVVRGAGADGGVVDALVLALEELAARPYRPVLAVDRRPGSAGRPLRIAAGPGLAAMVNVPRLRAAHGLHVEVTAATADLAGALDAGTVDLALNHSYAFLPDQLPESWPRRVVAPDEPVLVAVATSRPARPLCIDDLVGERWAVPSDPVRQALVRGLCGLGGAEARIEVVFDDPREVARAVAAGELVRLADPAAPAGAACVPVDHPAARRRTVLSWSPNNPVGSLGEIVAAELLRCSGARRPVRMAG